MAAVLDKRIYAPLLDEPFVSPKIVACDCETEGLGGRLLLISALDPETMEVIRWDSADQCLRWFLTKEWRGYSLVFHNLEYDARYFVAACLELTKAGFTLEPIFRGDHRLIAIFIRRGRHNWKITDSYALMPSSLKKLAKIAGMEKGEIGLADGVLFDPTNEAHLAYADQDVLVLHNVYHAYAKLVHEVFGVNVRLTAGATAVAAHRHTLERGYFRSRADVEAWLREAVYGGIAYLTTINEQQNLLQIDGNAMYATAMRRFGAPVGTAGYTSKEIGELPGVYDVEVIAPRSIAFTFVPYRIASGTTYPHGRFVTRISSLLIAKAREHGYVIHVIEGYVWPKTEFVHQRFVDLCESVEIKHKGEGLGDCVKITRNASYGKFLQRGVVEKYTIAETLPDGYTPAIDPVNGAIIPNVGYVEENAEAAHMQLAWGIWVMDGAKCLLVDAIYAIGPAACACGDTDSVIADRGAVERAIAAETLVFDRAAYGAFKIECAYKWYHPIAPKVGYGEKDDGSFLKKHKGIPHNSLSVDLLLAGNATNDWPITVDFSSLTKVKALFTGASSFVTTRRRSLSKIENSAGWFADRSGRVFPRSVGAV